MASWGSLSKDKGFFGLMAKSGKIKILLVYLVRNLLLKISGYYNLTEFSVLFRSLVYPRLINAGFIFSGFWG